MAGAGLDLFGFLEVAENLTIRHKSGGEARLGDVMRPNQGEFLARVAEYRKRKQGICWVELKARQFVSMSTTVGAVVTGDTQRNAGFNSIVTAQDADSLNEISQIYRYFFGRTKKEGVKKGKAERLGDNLFVATNGSRIKLQIADEDLGRSGNVTALHISEAGYIKDWQEAWRSVQPAITDAWWLFVIMETTLRRNQPGDFRDFIEELADAARNGKPSPYPPWEVHFTGWHANPTLRVEMNSRELADFKDQCPIYERELVTRHKLTWEQARWYFNTRVGGMLGSYEAMQEAYPTTLEEALATTKGGGFFSGEAMKFHTANCREPIQRLKFREGQLMPFEAGDSPLQAHVEVYEPPEFGAVYIIGADCCDESERIAVEGSENAAVVVNQDTGDVVAVYHGDGTAYEFAHLLSLLGARYNEAWLNPEWNNAGRAVIDDLRTIFNYSRLCPRIKFAYGHAAGFVEGHYGFDTRGSSRPYLLDRLQMGINRRLWGIPSKYVVDCCKNLAKRGGVKANQAKGHKPDDGAIALGLTGFGHDGIPSGLWTPKQAYVPKVVEVRKEPVARGYRVEADDRRRPGLRFDSVTNTWR